MGEVFNSGGILGCQAGRVLSYLRGAELSGGG